MYSYVCQNWNRDYMDTIVFFIKKTLKSTDKSCYSSWNTNGLKSIYFKYQGNRINQPNLSSFLFIRLSNLLDVT